MNTMFAQMLAAAAKVEVPVDGSTGVWLKQGAAVISSGMKMTGAVVGSGQSQYIYNRGVAQSCTMDMPDGIQYVASGGTALHTTVYYRQYVSSGGTAIHTVLGDSGTAPRLFMSAGAFASDTHLLTRFTAMQVPAGASAAGIAVSAGNAWITGNATNVAVLGGTATVYPGGHASGIALSSGALIVSSGGTALGVTSTGGTVNVIAGGYIEYVTP